MTTTPGASARGVGFSVGVRTLLGATAAALACGVLVTLLGGIVEGSRGAWGAGIGTAVCVGVFALGVFAVNAAARILPRAAVMVALLTYTLQVLAMAILFMGLSSSDVLDTSADRRWLGGAVIACTVGWLVAHLSLAVRQRIPAYDVALPEASGTTQATPGRAAGPTRLTPSDGGDR